MLGKGQGAGTADVLQADYFRRVLGEERAELASHLAGLTRRLTAHSARNEPTDLSNLRRSIRQSENDLRVLDRMIDALDGRFPIGADLRRRA
jgi:hypothetical protein